MHKKKLLIISILIFIATENNLLAKPGKNDREEYYLSALVRKYFGCCLRQRAFHNEQKRLFEQDRLFSYWSFHTKSKIENLPIEVLYLICEKLDPLDVISLSITCTNLRLKIDDEFWRDYIKFHNRKSWDLSTPAIKIACAYSFFERENIEKAAEFGLPEANRILHDRNRGRETAKREREYAFSYPESYDSNAPVANLIQSTGLYKVLPPYNALFLIKR